MDYTAETPRTARTIAGISVNVIQPFAEGQPLTAATAAMLNQTLAENFSNNTRKAIETALASDPNADIQSLVDKYMSEYQPGVRRAGTGEPRVTDPVEKEARKLAKARVLAAAKDKGLKAADVDVAGLTTRLYEANKEAFTAQAKAIVKASQKATEGVAGLSLDDLGLGNEAA